MKWHSLDSHLLSVATQVEADPRGLAVTLSCWRGYIRLILPVVNSIESVSLFHTGLATKHVRRL